MNNSQDIPCRRVYVVHPNSKLIKKVKKYRDSDLIDVISRPQVIMTAELPFEEYLEGWRTKILEICKLTFLKEILIEYQIMNKQVAEEILGSSEPSVKLFDEWWQAEEAEYTEIPTDWKTENNST